MTSSLIAMLSFQALWISDIIIRINSFIGVSNGATVLTLILNVLTVAGLLFIAGRVSWRDEIPTCAFLVFKWMVGWSLISFAHGIYKVNGYYEWKVLLLGYVFSILVPFAIALGVSYEVSAKTIKFILRWVFLFGFAFVPISLSYDTELYSRVVMPVTLFILFIPFLTWRSRLLVLCVAFLSVAMDPTYRINLIKILCSFGLLGCFYLRNLVGRIAMNLVVICMFIIPILFLYLGVTDEFNIFRDGLKEGLNTDYTWTVSEGSEIRDSHINSDTRTFLYREVFNSMLNRHTSFLIGEGGGAGYETEAFQDTVVTQSGRTGSEVGFLNLLLYSGVIGVLIYVAMLYFAAYFAINRSNNTLCKMIGVWLSAHWVMFFIEDIPKLDMNFYFIWFAIGLCLSHRFRSMTDARLREFFLLVPKQ
jgi:hypothetical protein